MSAIGRIPGGAGYRGIFVIPAGRTEIDGLLAPSYAALCAGSQWRWWGEALRIDGPAGLLHLDGAEGRAELRLRAARSARRLLGDLAAPAAGPRGGAGVPAGAAGFTVTDGHTVYRLGFAGDGSLLTADGALPPRDADLTVVERSGTLPDTARLPGAAGGAICFTPGTLIDTPEGPRPVEAIRPGDRVSTRDNGAQDVLWAGTSRLSGARLFAMPQLRPVRIRHGALGHAHHDGDLVVSPEHRLLLAGPQAQALFNECEVLAEARDLADGRAIRPETRPGDVTYVHLLTGRHEIVRANGVEAETFHPSGADLGLIGAAARAALADALRGAEGDPYVCGGFARRCLTRPEAAIFRHGGF